MVAFQRFQDRSYVFKLTHIYIYIFFILYKAAVQGCLRRINLKNISTVESFFLYNTYIKYHLKFISWIFIERSVSTYFQLRVILLLCSSFFNYYNRVGKFMETYGQKCSFNYNAKVNVIFFPFVLYLFSFYFFFFSFFNFLFTF